MDTSEHGRKVFDVLIIGAGPTGLFGAFYAGMRGMSTELIDSLEEPGGQLIALYPEKFIYDVAGFPAVLARTLVNELIKQVSQYKPSYALGEQVMQLHRHDGGIFQIITGKSSHWGRSVVIAAGAGAFTPKRLPEVNSDEYEGRGLSYFIRDMLAFREKHVLVIGGGDSAVDWALNLLRVTNKVTLIHRRDKFRAHEDSVLKLQSAPLTIRTFHELKKIHGEGRVQAATIFDNRTGQERTIEVDAILINVGFTSTLGPIREWGLELDKEGLVVTSRMETNIPGVFAAGDVASYPGKLKLIATGFGEAAVAVNHAKTFIDPGSRSFPGHSSSMIPKMRKGIEPHES